MRDFHNFLATMGEGVFDPKRNPKRRPYEKAGEQDPEDDDYTPPSKDDDFFGDDDDDSQYHGDRKLGLTAQFPATQALGKMRGFQIQTPKQALGRKDSISDGLRGHELFDTLSSKLRSGERMTPREIDILIKLLNKQDEGLRRPKKDRPIVPPPG